MASGLLGFFNLRVWGQEPEPVCGRTVDKLGWVVIGDEVGNHAFVPRKGGAVRVGDGYAYR